MPQRVDGVVARVAEPEVGARLPQRVVHAGGELHRHVELPAELAHVGDARGAHDGAGRAAISRDGRERKRRVGQIGVGDARQQLARARAHHAEHRVGAR